MCFCDPATLLPTKESATHLATAFGAWSWNMIPLRLMFISPEISATVLNRELLIHRVRFHTDIML